MSLLPIQMDALLREKTVFILGAGASKPYGFPLWCDLKSEMLGICDLLSDKPEYTDWGLEYWKSTLSTNTSKSVDTLAKEANDHSRTGFQILTGRILVEREKADVHSQKSDWIELFISKLATLCHQDGAGAVLPNLGFVNFNYDRCFAQRFSPFIGEIWNGFPGTWEREGVFPSYGTNWLEHIHPHGVVGGMTRNLEAGQHCGITASTFNNFAGPPALAYGDRDGFERLISQKQLGVMPVDVVGPETWHNRAQIAYVRAKSLLSSSKNVVFIGLSKTGWQQCHLELGQNQVAYSTGFDPISDSIECLKCHAKELVETL